MKKHRNLKIAGIATLAALAALAGIANSAYAGGADEGIVVHGHWTIEVRDSDGSVAERYEFENALTSQGSEMFTKLLGRVETPGDWEIRSASVASQEVCEHPAGTPTTICTIAEPTNPSTFNSYFKNLTVTVAPSAPFKLTLSGNIIAQRTGELSTVGVQLNACSSATAPDACPGTIQASLVDSQFVTSTTLGTPVPVVIGQQVLVSVEISFS